MVYHAVRRAASAQILDNNIPHAAATATIRAINPGEVILDVHAMPASDSALVCCSICTTLTTPSGFPVYISDIHVEFDSTAPRGAHSVFHRTRCRSENNEYVLGNGS